MPRIIKATVKDAAVLMPLAIETFIQSHGHSAPAADIDNYIAEKYSLAAFTAELNDPQNIYHIIYHDDKPAGFSKIIFNHPYDDSNIQNITKLERIYLLQQFYSLKLGKLLFEFNVALAKQAQQKGMWLYVWVENTRAFNFYTRAGFTITGSHDFRVSATHSNPNHRMYLEF
ncbi:GNAT family N-acetyltransferase [Ferruginibacter profundus]